MRARALALLAVCAPPLLAAGVPPAPFGDCAKSPNEPIFALAVRAMTMEAQAEAGLLPSQFMLRSGREPIRICGVTHDRQPVSAGILLDVSRSMGQWIFPAIARAGVEALLDNSMPRDEYFLEYVNTAATIRCGFGCDNRQIRAGLGVTSGKSTALIDGLLVALREMTKARNANKILFVISDGLDNSSRHSFKELERAFETAPLPIIFLVPDFPGIGHKDSDRGGIFQRLSLEQLGDLTKRSGGTGLIATSENDAAAGVTQIAATIHAPYMLYFATSLPTLPGLRVGVSKRPKPHLFYGGAFKTGSAAAGGP